jgi:uncharacterized coiled-coil protein SlyX
MPTRLNFCVVAICEDGRAFSGGRVPSTPQVKSTLRVVCPRLRLRLLAVADEASNLTSFSDDLLRCERGTLLDGVADLTRRAALHRQLLEQLEVELATQTRLLREIEELIDLRPQLRLERLDRQLRGRRLQEVAVEVLRRRVSDQRPVHYREWFAYLRAEGYEVVGRDPLATFLTQVSRAEGVERVGSRTGLYRVA